MGCLSHLQHLQELRLSTVQTSFEPLPQLFSHGGVFALRELPRVALAWKAHLCRCCRCCYPFSRTGNCLALLTRCCPNACECTVLTSSLTDVKLVQGTRFHARRAMLTFALLPCYVHQDVSLCGDAVRACSGGTCRFRELFFQISVTTYSHSFSPAGHGPRGAGLAVLPPFSKIQTKVKVPPFVVEHGGNIALG